MKSKEELNKEKKNQDKTDTPKVQRMDSHIPESQWINYKHLQEAAEFKEKNENKIIKTYEDDPNELLEQKKVEKLKEYIDKIPKDVKDRLTTLPELEFYAKCSMYLDFIGKKYENYSYLTSKLELTKAIENNPERDFNKKFISCFSSIYGDDVYGIEVTKETLINTFADYYKNSVDLDIHLFKSTKQALIEDIEIGTRDKELSGEVVSYLEDFYI